MTRFLSNETVSARPPSKIYKLQKTIQRNKLLFIGIGIIATLLVVSQAVILMVLAKERKTRLGYELSSLRGLSYSLEKDGNWEQTFTMSAS